MIGSTRVKAIAVLVLLASFFTIAAQTKSATTILNNVSKTYKGYKTIKATFQISIVNQQTNSKINQKGILYLKGKKFRINMTDQEIYCDGNKMWTYFKDENEVQISKYDPSEEEINPAEIFTIYQKGFDYKYIGQEMLGSKAIEIIELIPHNKNKPYFKVKLSIDKASHKIEQMQVLNKNGITSTYKITAFEGNININDTFFKFDEKAKPGVVKIDLSK